MRKNVEIHSIESIEERAKRPFDSGTILISMGDTGAEPPKLENQPDHILRLVFDDITLYEVRMAFDLPDDVASSDEKLIALLKAHDTTSFDIKMACLIADFIAQHFDNANTIICQCHYGQSRSAGCAAAIDEFYSGDGIKIFADDRFYPNKMVFRMVLEALMDKYKIGGRFPIGYEDDIHYR